MPMGTAGKIGIGLLVTAAAAGIAYAIVRVVRRKKPAAEMAGQPTTATSMSAMLATQAQVPPAKPSAKMEGRKRHSRFSKLRSIARTGIRAGAVAGIPGAGQAQALGLV